MSHKRTNGLSGAVILACLWRKTISVLNNNEVVGAAEIERHVVLVAPEIHWNTGNIGRTCLGAGARLHLIRPLGFSLDSRQVKRAGLDYWERVSPQIWESFDAFCVAMDPADDEVTLFTKSGPGLFWDIPPSRRLFLVFGSETSGLPASILDRYRASRYRIPTTGEIRSLNLSTAVGIALYESIRIGR